MGQNETMTNCHDLKMPAPDGKMRLIGLDLEDLRIAGRVLAYLHRV